jgi:hypothetical protein
MCLVLYYYSPVVQDFCQTSASCVRRVSFSCSSTKEGHRKCMGRRDVLFSSFHFLLQCFLLFIHHFSSSLIFILLYFHSSISLSHLEMHSYIMSFLKYCLLLPLLEHKLFGGEWGIQAEKQTPCCYPSSHCTSQSPLDCSYSQTIHSNILFCNASFSLF